MYQKTSNEYHFKYLQTGISGPGLQTVYLPPKPKDKDIHFKKEQKFIRPELSKTIAKAIRVMYAKADSKSPHYDPNYVSPYAAEIRKWEDQQWYHIQNGFWFWNNGVATYITGFYFWYLCEWMPYFGRPDYRETDKELTYFLQYVEEDPFCYGILFNSIRRYGKSAIMGGWITFGVTTNFRFFGGMQGETDKKVKKFWDLHIIKPFRKLMPYVQPKYDYSSKQTEEIKFERPVIKGEKSKRDVIENDDIFDLDEEDGEDLESFLDYRASGEGEYDQAVLHRYLHEEPGKKLQSSIAETWKVVKPCLRRGKFIRGKCFMGTTVEHMDVMDKGGKAYQKLFYASDFDKRGPLGQTESGLYACFLPGDVSYEGFFDDYGHPMKAEARRSIVLERESVKHNPKDYSDLIRKYPLTIAEIFWVSSERCVFNSTILQKRKLFLDSCSIPMYSRFDLEWENKKRFTRVIYRHNPDGGWFKASWMFPKESFETEANQVRKNTDGTYSPLNEAKFTSGVDPVDHRVQIEQRIGIGEDEFISARRSKPVMRIKRRYDSSIDGIQTEELLEQRRDEEYQYKTGISIGLMDVRTSDPNKYYERALMVCWLFGMSMNVESAKPGIINYFFEHGCADFIKNKYIPESNTKVRHIEAGTPANSQTINEYTDALATHIEYFAHTEPFVDLINDYLIFNPAKTKEHDYAVSSGWCELGEKIRPKIESRPMLDVTSIMPVFDKMGRVVRK
jgi:hypothetical protein